MNRAELSKALRDSLRRFHAKISLHIASVDPSGTAQTRTTGIEKIFADSFLDQIGSKKKHVLRREVPCSEVGTKTYADGHQYGMIDAAVESGGRTVLFEFKAVRMPPKKNHDSGFDIWQIFGDYLRIARAEEADESWIVCFVHGPVVTDSTSNGDLLQRFRNQMFVDVSRSKGNGKLKSYGQEFSWASDSLEWSWAKDDKTQFDTEFAVLEKSNGNSAAIGAVCFLARADGEPCQKRA